MDEAGMNLAASRLELSFLKFINYPFVYIIKKCSIMLDLSHGHACLRLENNKVQFYIIYRKSKRMKNYKTINSFTQTPSAAQIGAYILFLMQILIFFIIIQKHFVSEVKRITMIVIYSTSITIQIIITLITSLSDPSDSFMIKYRNDRSEIKNADVGNMLYCDICRSYVNVSSRHCRACVRCVEDFDHHCMWINNCVGGKNYRLFIVMISATFTSMVIYIASVGMLWGEGLYSSFILQMGFVWGSSIIVIIFILLILNLILLHIYLNYLGLTTYQFIIKRRQQSELQRANSIEQQLTQQAIQTKNKKNKKQMSPQLKQQNQKASKNRKSQGPALKMSRLSSTDSKNANEINSEASLKNLGFNTSQVKIQKIFPDGTQLRKQTIIGEEQFSIADSVSERESIRISQYFARNKSLAILVKSDVIVPERKSQNFPKTCKNTRQINKGFKNK